MLGGEFDHHGAQLGVECLNQDPQHPATASLGKTWTITQEEMYQFKNYDPAKVHDLLSLDKKPRDTVHRRAFPGFMVQELWGGQSILHLARPS